jgi:pimeloyl-ACP methyl ester carboxylesterase
MEKPISFDSDGLKLYAILGLPDAGPAKQGVVLIHGWSGYRIGPNRILVRTARALNKAGFATLRFDLRGRGDSEGESAETDLDAMIADTCRAASVLKEQGGITHVALLGICSGANVAVGAATLMPGGRELVLWSIMTFQPQKKRADAARRTGHFALGYLGKLFRAETWRRLFSGEINFKMVWRVLFGSRSAEKEGRNLKDSSRDIMDEFTRYRGRALFIHGNRDPEARGAREVFQQFCPAHSIAAEFVLIDGSNHNFHSLKWMDDVITRSITWLQADSSSKERAT